MESTTSKESNKNEGVTYTIRMKDRKETTPVNPISKGFRQVMTAIADNDNSVLNAVRRWGNHPPERNK